ncbi:MAG: hypothetical protein D6725_04875 [Planctomycetota bacterium]|nr:MAG: hypothetical protein D6725_04875 [Planctomycetota bacterium]
MSEWNSRRSLFDPPESLDSWDRCTGEPYRLIGVDEAGYGPNLGPLVIAATDWRVPGQCLPESLYEILAGGITPTAQEASDGRVLVADSKIVHQSSAGIRRLEISACALLEAAGIRVQSFRQVLAETTPNRQGEISAVPWYSEDVSLPLSGAVEEIRQAAQRLHATMCQANVALVGVRVDLVPAALFNVELERYGTKGRVLSERSLRLLRRMVDRHPSPERTRCVCDKHGGRSSYGALLAAAFETNRIACVRETPQLSEYSIGSVHVRFCCRAERFVPVAAASVIAKYLREVAMHAFNRYWQNVVRGVRPTKGYPADARRFYAEIRHALPRCGVDERTLWRRR